MLNKDHIDTEYLDKKAYRLKASTVTDAIQTYIESKGKEKPEHIPNWTELTERLREYSDERNNEGFCQPIKFGFYLVGL